MVPALSFVFMAVSLLISVGVPVLLTIWVMKKFKPGFWCVLSGMIIFVGLQYFFRIPLIQVFGVTDFGKAFIENNMLLYIGILSITAGIVEEFGRYFAFKVMMRRRREFRHGLAYGIGHGGIEAILLVGIAYVSNIVLGVSINAGAFSALTGAAATAMQPTIDVLVNTPPIHFLLGGAERIFAICFHIAMSILVLHGVRKRNIGYTILAVFLHGAVNFGAVMIAQNFGALLSEVFMLVVAIVSIVFVVLMKRLFEKQDGPPMLDGC